MIRFYCLLSLLIAWSWHGDATAQPVRALSAEEAVALGVAHSRGLDAGAERVTEAAASLREARTLRRPVLSTQGSYLRLSPNVPGFEVSLPAMPGGGATLVPAIHDRFALQLSVRQPVFTGGRLRHGVRAAGYLAEAARQERRGMEADLALRIHQAYWALYEAEAVRGVVAEAVGLVEEHRANVLGLREQGLATTRDVLAVEARLADVRLREVEATSAARQAELSVNHLLGLPLATDVAPEPPPEAGPPPDDLGALVDAAVERRAAVEAAAYRVDALASGAAAAAAERYPQVALSGTYRQARPNPYFLPPEDAFRGTWDVGVVVSINLWRWGRTDAQVDAARARQRQAEAGLAELHDAVRLEVHRRAVEVEQSAATVAATRQSVAAAEEAFRVMREHFAQGLALNADVLDAEVALREAETRHRRALAHHAAARAALRHATGDLR